MAGPPRLLPMSMSPQSSRPSAVGHAASQWVRSRRGRVFVLSMVLAFVVLVIGGARNSEVCPYPSTIKRSTSVLCMK